MARLSDLSLTPLSRFGQGGPRAALVFLFLDDRGTTLRLAPALLRAASREIVFRQDIFRHVGDLSGNSTTVGFSSFFGEEVKRTLFRSSVLLVKPPAMVLYFWMIGRSLSYSHWATRWSARYSRLWVSQGMAKLWPLMNNWPRMNFAAWSVCAMPRYRNRTAS